MLLVALRILGAVVNTYIPWNWLTPFFIFLRQSSMLFDFIWDIPTMWIIVGITMVIEIAIWIFRATLLFINWFR